jgi:hypothetical protein
MTLKRSLLTLAISCWLAAPAFAQEAAPAPTAEDPSMPAAEPAAVPAPQDVPAAAPDVAPTRAEADMPVEPEDDEGADKCALGDLCLGPVFTLGAINPLGLGVHARYGEHLGFGLDWQFIPSLSFGSASAGWGMVAGEGRWYPFGGAFFLSGGLSYQYFNASASAGSGSTRIDVSGSVGIPSLKLGLGLMGHDGFVMGIDLGFQIPLGGTNVDFDAATGGGAADTAMVGKMHKDIADAADAGIGLIPVIPQLNLLRIGYLF